MSSAVALSTPHHYLFSCTEIDSVFLFNSQSGVVCELSFHFASPSSADTSPDDADIQRQTTLNSIQIIDELETTLEVIYDSNWTPTVAGDVVIKPEPQESSGYASLCERLTAQMTENVNLSGHFSSASALLIHSCPCRSCCPNAVSSLFLIQQGKIYSISVLPPAADERNRPYFQVNHSIPIEISNRISSMSMDSKGQRILLFSEDSKEIQLVGVDYSQDGTRVLFPLSMVDSSSAGSNLFFQGSITAAGFLSGFCPPDLTYHNYTLGHTDGCEDPKAEEEGDDILAAALGTISKMPLHQQQVMLCSLKKSDKDSGTVIVNTYKNSKLSNCIPMPPNGFSSTSFRPNPLPCRRRRFLSNSSLSSSSAVRWRAQSPLFFGVDKGNKLWMHRMVFKSDFPGPMYPIGFHLIQKIQPYIEAEDELDTVVPNPNDKTNTNPVDAMQDSPPTENSSSNLISGENMIVDDDFIDVISGSADDENNCGEYLPFLPFTVSKNPEAAKADPLVKKSQLSLLAAKAALAVKEKLEGKGSLLLPSFMNVEGDVLEADETAEQKLGHA